MSPTSSWICPYLDFTLLHPFLGYFSTVYNPLRCYFQDKNGGLVAKQNPGWATSRLSCYVMETVVTWYNKTTHGRQAQQNKPLSEYHIRQITDFSEQYLFDAPELCLPIIYGFDEEFILVVIRYELIFVRRCTWLAQISRRFMERWRGRNTQWYMYFHFLHKLMTNRIRGRLYYLCGLGPDASFGPYNWTGQLVP